MDGIRAVSTAVIEDAPEAREDESTPFDREQVIMSKRDYIALKARANYFEKLHALALVKIQKLETRIEKLTALVRDLRQRYFGRRSEKSAAPQDSVPIAAAAGGAPNRAPERRARGQRRGSAGHGRTPVPHLPVVLEQRDLGPEERCCAVCHEPLEAAPDRVSEIIELQTRVVRRRIVRKCYRRCCCPGSVASGASGTADTPETPAASTVASIIAAPVPPRLIPKGKLGVSIWVEVLLDKFHGGRPTQRLLQMWRSFGLPVSAGTIAGGLRQLGPLFSPLMQAFKKQQLSEQLFNADETFWRVFERIADKVGYRWYLWTFISPSVCFYILDPSRSAKVPLEHFGALLQNAILMVDRYSAYKKLPRTLGILLSFCWAHVRRDQLELARNYPLLQDFALGWVKRIGTLYHLNHQRLQARREEYAGWDAQLRAHVAQMAERCALDLRDPTLHPAARKCLESLQRHWAGLVLFVEHPELEMDNNRAERMLRNAVCGRKNYYGSGSLWSAALAANLFTLFMTLVHCWKINPRRWLSEYLQACAENGGAPPGDLSSFLPWQVSPARLQALRAPMPVAGYNTA